MSDRPYRRWRLVLPLMLLLVGALLLTGCLIIPTFDKTIGGRNVANEVGGPHSGKPLRVGYSSMADVAALLGKPHYVSHQGSRVAYSWQVRHNLLVWPLCFQVMPDDGEKLLVLTFDDAGILRSSRATNEPADYIGFDRDHGGANWPVPPARINVPAAPTSAPTPTDRPHAPPPPGPAYPTLPH